MSYFTFGCMSFCPQDWDKPENIPDPDAKKPDDWDEEMDGEWEPPMIPNPEYKVHPTCHIYICLCKHKRSKYSLTFINLGLTNACFDVY